MSSIIQLPVPQLPVSKLLGSYVHRADWVNMDKRARNRALLYSAQSGCLHCVNRALSTGADVNTTDERLEISPLMEAVCEGHSSCVQTLLCRGAYVNKIDKTGNTSLMYAVKTRNIDVGNVKILLHHGADVNKQDKEGNSSLTFAAGRGDHECVNLLIQAGADMNLMTNNGNTALICAVEVGNYTCVDALIKAGADVNSAQNKFGQPSGRRSALHIAAEAGLATLVNLLIKAGANVNAKTQGYSALMLAAASGNERCVLGLIGAGADVNEEANDGKTALSLAAQYGCEVCVGILFWPSSRLDKNTKDMNGMRAVMFAARGGHYGCLKTLMGSRYVSTIDDTDNYQETALMHAARSYTDISIAGDNCISLLLAKGVNVNAKNHHAKTALMIAVENGHVEKTRLFLQNGANVNIQDSCGNTAVMLAVKAGSSRCLSLLIEAGADVNVPDRSGFKSLLMLAVSTGNDKCVNLLTEEGANVNIKETGITPLILAVESGNEKCLKQLVKTGADVNLSNARGETALMLALKNNQANDVNLLLEAGADVNIANKRQVTTLCYALETGNSDFIRVTIQAGADRWGHRLICEIIEEADENVSIAEIMIQIKMLLCAGAYVNIDNESAIFSCIIRFEADEQRKLVRLLFAAGERMDSKKVKKLLPSEQMGLMHLCREAIREHLLQMSKMNLIVRIPELGLPSQMVDYLLYGVTLSDIMI